MKKVLVGLALVGAIGCGKKDSDKIAEAQACLDSSTGAAALSCANKVDGLSSKESYLIRCSAAFIAEGIAEPATLVQAFQNLDAATNPVSTFMNILAFDMNNDPTEDKAFAQATFNNCNSAGNPGFVLIAGYANMATAISAVATVNLSDGISPTEVTDIIAAGPDAIAATATAVYTTSCTTGNESNAELCAELGTAITSAGGDNEALANALLAQWDTTP